MESDSDSDESEMEHDVTLPGGVAKRQRNKSTESRSKIAGKCVCFCCSFTHLITVYVSRRSVRGLKSET